MAGHPSPRETKMPDPGCERISFLTCPRSSISEYVASRSRWCSPFVDAFLLLLQFFLLGDSVDAIRNSRGEEDLYFLSLLKTLACGDGLREYLPPCLLLGSVRAVGVLDSEAAVFWSLSSKKARFPAVCPNCLALGGFEPILPLENSYAAPCERPELNDIDFALTISGTDYHSKVQAVRRSKKGIRQVTLLEQVKNMGEAAQSNREGQEKKFVKAGAPLLLKDEDKSFLPCFQDRMWKTLASLDRPFPEAPFMGSGSAATSLPSSRDCDAPMYPMLDTSDFSRGKTASVVPTRTVGGLPSRERRKSSAELVLLTAVPEI
ncbi:hypothetical protein Tco_0773443 [Tanacetum coccineum]|uniref:Uncharacterized protein n=1 Tax=Tanacetum coccineum TaxID=301880 RepID=A0ABQ4ZPG2_9ASTR